MYTYMNIIHVYAFRRGPARLAGADHQHPRHAERDQGLVYRSMVLYSILYHVLYQSTVYYINYSMVYYIMLYHSIVYYIIA